jgi:hypothetical protein
MTDLTAASPKIHTGTLGIAHDFPTTRDRRNAIVEKISVHNLNFYYEDGER